MKDVEKYENKLECLKDKFYSMVECGANKPYEEIDAEELGEVMDMLKDACEACYYLNAANYYKTVTDAMDESDLEDKEMYMNKYLPETRRNWYGGSMMPGNRIPRYYTRPRRYMYSGDYGIDYDLPDKYYYFNENEHWPNNARYYAGNAQMGNTQMGNANVMHDPREGKSGIRRRMYMETRDNPAMDNASKSRELENYMTDLAEDMTELIQNMDVNDRQMLKQRLSSMVTRL